MATGDFDIESIYPGYTKRLFQIESGGDPRAQTGSNRGLGQFSPDLERKYGITDANRTSYEAQARAVNQEAAEHYQLLSSKLGRPPTAAELYLTHQQGVGGGPALLTADPNQPAWMTVRNHGYDSDRMAQLAIGGNVPAGSPIYHMPSRDITAGQFRDLWSAKFNGTPMAPAGGGDAAAAAAASAQTGAGSSNPLVGAAAGLLKGLQSQPLQPAPMPNLLSGPRGPNPYLQQLMAAMQQNPLDEGQTGGSSPA